LKDKKNVHTLILFKNIIILLPKGLGIRRGLRALEAREFPMPSYTVVLARMLRELATEVAKTMPPQEKIIF